MPLKCCINKFDINPGRSKKMAVKAAEKGINIIGQIRYDRAVTEAQLKGLPVVEYTNNTTSQNMRRVWENLLEML